MVASQTAQAHGDIPKAQLTQQLYRAEDKTPEEGCEMLQGAMTEDLLNQLAVSELEFNLQPTAGETAVSITGETHRSPRPLQSNKPAEGNNGHDSTVGEATERGFFSVEGNSNNNSRVPSNIQSSSAKRPPFSVTLEVESETSQGKNAASPEIEEREKAVTTTPTRPITPEAPHSPQNPLVTGLNSSYQSNAGAGAHPPVNHEPDSKNSGGDSGNPAEHDDTEHRELLFAEAHLPYKVIHHRPVLIFTSVYKLKVKLLLQMKSLLRNAWA